MAGLTKEQRLAKEKAKEEQLRAEIEAKLRAEYEEKLKNGLDKVDTVDKTENTKSIAKRVQKTNIIPLDTIVPVVCNTVGILMYVSKKTMGYQVEWDEYGSVEYMELGELVSMRNTDRRFFEDNWIVLDDTYDYTSKQLYDFLKVTKYYEDILTPDTMDDVFSMSGKEIEEKVTPLSKGMKQTIASIAKARFDSGNIDQNIVKPLETALDIQFTF